MERANCPLKTWKISATALLVLSNNEPYSKQPSVQSTSLQQCSREKNEENEIGYETDW